jgi:hypothetical protein
VRDYIKPNGNAPLIGDNDNGRLLPFIENDFNNHNYLVEIASDYYGDSTLQKSNNVDSYFALEGIEKMKMGGFDRNSIGSRLYSEAGFSILREKDFYLFFKNEEYSKNATETSKIVGTHTHSDALSFELCIGENDFIIDPGTYCYTSSKELRNEFRSTKKHNTLQVDDLDQIELITSNLFCVKGYRYPDKIYHYKERGMEVLKGSFQWGFGDIEKVIHNRRIVYCDPQKYQVIDEIVNENFHKFSLYYHFSNDLKVVLEGNSVILKARNGAVLKMDIESSDNVNLKIIDDTISPSFGVLKKSKTLSVECFSKKNVSFITNFNYQINAK